MKRVISIAGALIFGVGLSVALAAWWMSASEKSDLAAQVAELRQANAEKESSLRVQALDYEAKLRELTQRDSDLNAFLGKLLAETTSAMNACDAKSSRRIWGGGINS